MLLRNDWKGACDLIVRPRDGGRPRKDLDAARDLWDQTHDATACYAMLTTRASQISPEGQILASLAADPGNFQTALFKLQRNTRLLYIHAYQSYIWNMVVSRRVSNFGTEVLNGDLVLQMDSTENEDRAPVQTVTADNRNNFTIWDVVLPLPGFAIKYPENEQRLWFEEVVKNDGFSGLDCFDNKNRGFAMRGSYRKIFCLPDDFTYEVKTYHDPDQALVKTDWDLMLEADESLRTMEEKKMKAKHDRRERERALQPDGEKKEFFRKNRIEPAAQKNGAHQNDLKNMERTAVIMSFNLPAASYATMLLREFLRSEAEEGFQTNFSKDLSQKNENE